MFFDAFGPLRGPREPGWPDRKETIQHAIDIARPLGQVVFFGLPDTSQPVPFSYSKFFMKQLRMYGVVGAQAEADLSSFHKALDWIARREINVSEMVSHRLPLEAIDRAMLVAMNGTKTR